MVRLGSWLSESRGVPRGHHTELSQQRRRARPSSSRAGSATSAGYQIESGRSERPSIPPTVCVRAYPEDNIQQEEKGRGSVR